MTDLLSDGRSKVIASALNRSLNAAVVSDQSILGIAEDRPKGPKLELTI